MTNETKEFNSFSFKVRMILTSIIQWYRWKKCRLQGYDIKRGTQLERGLNLDRINPWGVHVGKDCIITSGVSIYSHKLVPHKVVTKEGMTRVTYSGYKVDTYIGDGCVLGIRSIVLGGVRIGNNCIVGAGAVVSKDVPDNCVVAGNPARIIKENINYDGYII